MTALARKLGVAVQIDIDFKTYGPFLALAALIVLGTTVNPAFLSEGNLTNLLTRSAFIGIIAVGATFVITAGGIDLSVGSMAAFIAGMMVIVLNSLLGGLGAGLVVGPAGIGASILSAGGWVG